MIDKNADLVRPPLVGNARLMLMRSGAHVITKREVSLELGVPLSLGFENERLLKFNACTLK